MKLKHLLGAAVVAASTLAVGAAPRPAAAETAAARADDGVIPVYDSSGKIIGYIYLRPDKSITTISAS